MLIPVIISLVDFKKYNTNTLKYLDNYPTKLLLLTIGLIILSISGRMGKIQWFCLLSLIPLLLYNGKVGNKKFKYAFYAFYPIHLIIIEGISYLL